MSSTMMMMMVSNSVEMGVRNNWKERENGKEMNRPGTAECEDEINDQSTKTGRKLTRGGIAILTTTPMTIFPRFLHASFFQLSFVPSLRLLLWSEAEEREESSSDCEKQYDNHHV